jgi:hypothetical protein
MKNDALKPGYECVFTVTEYYDGPRKGIANYHGRPHFYDCVFDESNDDYSDLFQLTPVDTEIFELAMEDWDIWRRWEIAFHTGKADIATHPALAHETKRHAELKMLLDKSLVTDPSKAFAAVGQFEVLGGSNLPKGVYRDLQVKWVEPPQESPPKSLDVR